MEQGALEEVHPTNDFAKIFVQDIIQRTLARLGTVPRST